MAHSGIERAGSKIRRDSLAGCHRAWRETEIGHIEPQKIFAAAGRQAKNIVEDIVGRQNRIAAVEDIVRSRPQCVERVRRSAARMGRGKNGQLIGDAAQSVRSGLGGSDGIVCAARSGEKWLRVGQG